MGWQRGGGRRTTRGENGMLVLCAGERKRVVEERESEEARLLVCAALFSLYLPARAGCFALAFSLLCPLAFLDLVAQIQGGGGGRGKRRARQRQRAKRKAAACGQRGEVKVKLKEQGAQMAVDSSGVDKAVCWSPRGQFRHGIKKKCIPGWPVFGVSWYSVCHSWKNQKAFLNMLLANLRLPYLLAVHFFSVHVTTSYFGQHILKTLEIIR